MRKVGLWLAIAALLVNGPRFVLIFLRVDGINIPLQAEAMMLGATGVATGLVLTGGGAYIAHRLAESQARGMIQFVMILCWFSLLVFTVILLAPLLVLAIRLSPLNTVFTTSFFQWIWSITAVAAVEIISAGAMAAYALEGKKQEDAFTETQYSPWSVLTGALVRRIEQSITSPSAVVTPLNGTSSSSDETSFLENVAPSIPSQEQTVQAEKSLNSSDAKIWEKTLGNESETKQSKTERQQLLLTLLRDVKQETDIQIDELARTLHVSRQTIYRDLADLKSKRLLQFQA